MWGTFFALLVLVSVIGLFGFADFAKCDGDIALLLGSERRLAQAGAQFAKGSSGWRKRELCAVKEGGIGGRISAVCKEAGACRRGPGCLQSGRGFVEEFVRFAKSAGVGARGTLSG